MPLVNVSKKESARETSVRVFEQEELTFSITQTLTRVLLLLLRGVFIRSLCAFALLSLCLPIFSVCVVEFVVVLHGTNVDDDGVQVSLVQCDQMPRMLFQFLATYNNENLANSI